MKYAAFAAVLFAAVPLMALGASTSARVRSALLTALAASVALGDVANINFLSLEHYRGTARGFAVSATDLIAWALVAGLALRFPARLQWLPYNSVPMGLLFAIACLTALHQGHPVLSAFGLFTMLRVGVVYWCVVNALRLGAPTAALWRGMAVAAAVVTLVTVWQKYADGVTRTPGPFDHANTIPSFVVLVLPVVLVWSLCDRDLSGRQAAAGVASAFAMVFAVVATLSRAGMVLAVVAVVTALAACALRLRSRRVWLASVAVVVVLLAASAKAADTVIERFRSAPQESAMARHEFNEAAWLTIRDHAFGVGLNNFPYFLTTHPEYRRHFVAMAGEEEVGVVHNIYLLTAAELGYPGLAVFVVLLARFAWIAARWGLASRSLESLLLLGLGIGLVLLYAVESLEWTLRIDPVSYQFALCAGAAAALGERVRRARQPARVQA